MERMLASAGQSGMSLVLQQATESRVGCHWRCTLQWFDTHTICELRETGAALCGPYIVMFACARPLYVAGVENGPSETEDA
jgi:hypothetical protein